ncbi:MAG: hypothetical protein COA88_12575 [Kordia sp.]|nr:MAG: hypothetical protein COA88_12575 [Kordia sp.]
MTKSFLVFLSLFTCITFSQNFNPKTLVLPDNPIQEDFSFLKEELKGIQVIMLGELTHDDGNVFEMKTQIVKYLHQEMGFNTIAFESGTYELYKAEEDIKSHNKDVKTAFQNSIFGIWSQTKEFESFTDFYKQHKNNIKLFGFDHQNTGSYSDETLVSDLYQYCKRHTFKFPLDQEDVSLLIESIYTSRIYDTHDIPYKKFISTLKNLIKQINTTQVNEEHFHWKIIIQNLLKNASDLNPKYNTLKAIKASEDEYIKEHLEVFKRNRNEIKELAQEKFTTDYGDNPRDEIMGKNLLAYIKKHPNEKIICWGANAHFVNNMTSVDFPIIKGFKPMGSYIKNSLKEKVYSLALVTAEVKINKKNFKFDTPIKENSFEEFLKQQNQKHLFISSNQPEMSKPIFSRFFSYKTFIETRLNQLHDGYIYLNKVVPSTWIQKTYHDNFDTGSLTVSKNNNLFTNDDINLEDKNTLDEVVLNVRASPKTIIKNVITQFKKNYPISPFKVNRYSNIVVKIQDSTKIDFDFIDYENDHGYYSIFYSIGHLKAVKINKSTNYKPKSTWEFNHYGGVINPFFKRASLISKRKIKKFKLTLQETIKLNGNTTYVIDFTTNRDGFHFTSKRYLSNYSGTLYINKKDNAIVKVEENWHVVHTDDWARLKMGNGWKKEFINNQLTHESSVTTYLKHTDNKYYRDTNINTKQGELAHQNGTTHAYTIHNYSKWYSIKTNVEMKYYNIFDPKKGKLKKIENNPDFWKKFKHLKTTS